MQRWVLGILCLFVFTACQDIAIVHDLTERDANEILVLLSRNGISASKTKEEKNQTVTWIINVKPADETQARTILVANNLPRVRHGGLEGICKEAGLILTPKTEKCREILAFKGEIINSLESIPGVVSADVVLNIPDKEEFPDENTPTPRPTASVTIQYLKDAKVKTELGEGKIQEFVANGVSGLDARDVTVIISYFDQKVLPDAVAPVADSVVQGSVPATETQTTPQAADDEDIDDLDGDETDLVSIGGLVMDGESAKKFKLIAALFLILLLLLAAAFIYALLKMSRLRKQSPVESEPADDDGPKKLTEAQKK